ncbi:GGDEF domain-containing protein [Nocardia stercoris]|uniref:GGDEF domain-containing protein n=1 Tax=Nocardia stercoris TaxID=2483361 RepID=A0A3M2LCI8_9NOCA|nr:GGDEF domain-containing protein [Nocardia stercoris]RMI35221.1 GGDEF domain-containing protein [Nocardia stercoris]
MTHSNAPANEGAGTGRGIHRQWWGPLALILLICILAPLFTATIPTIAVSLAEAAVVTAMIVIGLHRHHPAAPMPWYLLAASTVLFCTGVVLADTPGFGSGTPLLLAGYATVLVAACLWLAPRRHAHDRDLLLDSGLLGLGAVLAAWTFMISPMLHRPELTGGDLTTVIAYPLLDAGLLTVTVHSIITCTRSEQSLRLIHTGLLTLVVVDVAHQLELIGVGNPTTNRLLEAPLMLSYLLIGLAALHPTMRTVGEPHRVRPDQSRKRASAIAVILVVASLIPTFGSGLAAQDRIVVSVLLALLLIGVLVRGERAIARSSRSERRAQYQADHDMLTGLVNRSALLRMPARNRERWAGKPLCLLFIDLDGFKSINDNHGHAVGDELIANAAARIRRTIRRDDVAARYGGDEFVVLGCAGRQEAAVLAERLLAALSKPFELSVGEVTIAASIGIACSHGRGTENSVYDLLRAADSAMYQAKQNTLGYVFHEDMKAVKTARVHRVRPASGRQAGQQRQVTR